MGKISIKFDLSMSSVATGLPRNGIYFEKIQQIINSLPGKTIIISFLELPQNFAIFSTIWELIAENDNFDDGTEVTGKYRTKTSIINGVLRTCTLFDGIDIISPNQANATQPGNGGGTITSVGTTYSSSVPVNITISPPKYVVAPTVANLLQGAPVYKGIYKDFDISFRTSNCTCGAETVGGLHSNWCDTNGLKQ